MRSYSRRTALASAATGVSAAVGGYLASGEQSPTRAACGDQPARRAAIEREILEMANQYRVRRENVSPVSAYEPAAAVIDAHCRDMIDRGYFGHTDPDGQGPHERNAKADLGCRGVGEVLARRPQEPDSPPAAEAAKIVSQWIYSEAHFEAMTADWPTRAGVAVRMVDDSHPQWPNSMVAGMMLTTDCPTDDDP